MLFYSGNTLLSTLEDRLRIYKEHRTAAQKAGLMSMAKRKARRIKQYQDALDRVRRGELIELASLPNPGDSSSPINFNKVGNR